MTAPVEVSQYSDEFCDEITQYCAGATWDKNLAVKMELYDKINYAKMFFEFCKRYCDIDGKRFIEIGCGTGTVSVAASLMGATVAASDFVQKSVDLTQMRWREHGIEGDLFQGDLRDEVAPHRVGAFDFVFCYQVLEHIPRAGQFRALGKLFSMVAPGGFLFIDTENSLCPFDRHDTQTWLVRYLTKPVHVDILQKLGRALNYWEPSTGGYVHAHDYLSYDEIIGAAAISGFDVVSPFMPHGDKKQMLRVLTKSDWLHDSLLHAVDIERFAPISILLQKQDPALAARGQAITKGADEADQQI